MARARKKVYEVYEFLRIWKEEHDGNSPTYAEISTHFSWKSETTAFWAINLLKDEGLVILDDCRRITLPEGEYIPPKSKIAPPC